MDFPMMVQTTMVTTSTAQHSRNIPSFENHLKQSKRILALVGAGLSASGLPKFQDVGGLWRKHNAAQLSRPEAFQREPSLVWQFYNYRRHLALKAKPNGAHYALGELANYEDAFLTLNQNIDGTSHHSNANITI
jgi:NAD-dependent deacetylase sirtuin 5